MPDKRVIVGTEPNHLNVKGCLKYCEQTRSSFVFFSFFLLFLFFWSTTCYRMAVKTFLSTLPLACANKRVKGLIRDRTYIEKNIYGATINEDWTNSQFQLYLYSMTFVAAGPISYAWIASFVGTTILLTEFAR